MRRLIVAVLFAACGGLVASCSRIYVTEYGVLASEVRRGQPEELVLEFDRCTDAVQPFVPYVAESAWLDDGRYYVRAFINPNCGDAFWSGDYEVVLDNVLRLEYAAIRNGEDACTCRVELEYWISGLPQRDYTITLHDAGVVVP